MKLNFLLTYLLTLLIGCLQFAFGQDRSMGTLPLVQNNKASISRTSENTNSPEYFAALQIFNRLVQARGDFRLPVPRFTMRNEDRNVAFINYSVPEVILETKAYKVCESFGEHKDAAIAFLLGHELTHYYEKHSWRREFIYDYRDLPIGKELADLSDDVVHETEADYIGGFLAYSAGFGLFDQASNLIHQLYKAYKLPDTINGYPSLQDRKILSQRSVEKLDHLVDVFETANLLHATGFFQQALQFYNYVLQQYSSRELYNNMGVTALMYARKFFTPSELKFKFFPELDLESSVQTRGETADSMRIKYLKQSILHFDAAISLDPDYAPAYFNKAIAFALLKDHESARFYAGKEALQRTSETKFTKTKEDIRLLLATLDAIDGNIEKARIAMEELSEKGHTGALQNLEILNSPINTQTRFNKKNQIFSKNPNLKKIENALILGESLPVDTLISQDIDKNLKLHKNGLTKESKNLKIVEMGNVYLIFQIDTVSSLPIQNSFASKNDLMPAILEKYGQPHHLVETPNGRLLVYHDKQDSALSSGIIIEFNSRIQKLKYILFKQVIQ
ncbi:MAG: hypothetical protein IPM92_10470 [Saprospiraceae bacterium]|nr:hypothetical protein [Saprospiraceae bacterium]